MNTSKLIASLVLAMFAIPSTFAYTEVECSSDPVFAMNSCQQCFDGGSKEEGSTIGFLSDTWTNTSDADILLFKEEQEMPRMVNLDPVNVSWSETPSSEDFWEYTDEFEEKYSEDQQGYVLKGGEQVTWLKSRLGYAYSLDEAKVPSGTNAGLLIYPIATHTLYQDGDMSIDSEVHNECVLYKVGEKTEITPPEKLPETGPAEYFLLVILALILGFALIRFKKA